MTIANKTTNINMQNCGL